MEKRSKMSHAWKRWLYGGVSGVGVAGKGLCGDLGWTKSRQTFEFLIRSLTARVADTLELFSIKCRWKTRETHTHTHTRTSTITSRHTHTQAHAHMPTYRGHGMWVCANVHKLKLNIVRAMSSMAALITHPLHWRLAPAPTDHPREHHPLGDCHPTLSSAIVSSKWHIN